MTTTTQREYTTAQHMAAALADVRRFTLRHRELLDADRELGAFVSLMAGYLDRKQKQHQGAAA